MGGTGWRAHVCDANAHERAYARTHTHTHKHRGLVDVDDADAGAYHHFYGDAVGLLRARCLVTTQTLNPRP